MPSYVRRVRAALVAQAVLTAGFALLRQGSDTGFALLTMVVAAGAVFLAAALQPEPVMRHAVLAYEGAAVAFGVFGLAGGHAVPASLLALLLLVRVAGGEAAAAFLGLPDASGAGPVSLAWAAPASSVPQDVLPGTADLPPPLPVPAPSVPAQPAWQPAVTAPAPTPAWAPAAPPLQAAPAPAYAPPLQAAPVYAPAAPVQAAAAPAYAPPLQAAPAAVHVPPVQAPPGYPPAPPVHAAAPPSVPQQWPAAPSAAPVPPQQQSGLPVPSAPAVPQTAPQAAPLTSAVPTMTVLPG